MAKNFVTLDINKVETALGVELKRNLRVLGLDTATKTGYAIIETTDKKLKINTGFINLHVKGIKDKNKRDSLRYNAVFRNFSNLINMGYDKVVIENVYYSRNANTAIILARIGAIAYSVARQYGIENENIIWRLASQARKAIGLNGKAKKLELRDKINTLLDKDLTNEDEVDAIILALNGLLEE